MIAEKRREIMKIETITFEDKSYENEDIMYCNLAIVNGDKSSGKK